MLRTIIKILHRFTRASRVLKALTRHVCATVEISQCVARILRRHPVILEGVASTIDMHIIPESEWRYSAISCTQRVYRHSLHDGNSGYCNNFAGRLVSVEMDGGCSILRNQRSGTPRVATSSTCGVPPAVGNSSTHSPSAMKKIKSSGWITHGLRGTRKLQEGGVFIRQEACFST